MGDEFHVLVEHLPKTSSAPIEIKCDYCGEKFDSSLAKRTKAFKQNPTTLKDVCKNKKCLDTKITETNQEKYGVDYAISSDVVRNKITQTFNDKYGVENPFQLESVKIKIVNFNLRKYGVSSYTQTDEYTDKRESTNLKRYGFKVASQSPVVRKKLKGKTSGEKHYNWKGGVSKENTLLRQSSDYKNWRSNVYNRDEYTCQCCGKKGVNLNAHHIKNFSNNKSKRYDIENGITLCVGCHNYFHRLYGRKNNNLSQLQDFIVKYG